MALRSFTEQRRHARVGVVRQIALRLEGARASVPAQLVDLSQSGLRGVAALPEIAIGAHVSVDV